jgi:hypothetical protein
MELPETQRQYQAAKQQIGEGNYGQAIVPGLYAGLGGLDATADAAMAAAGVWPPVLAGALGAKFLAKSGKAVLKAADLDPSGFYSSTRRAIEGLPQETGTGKQFGGLLPKLGAKGKEMEDSGVTALLASRGPNRVTKEELLEQHDRGRPQFREKWKSEARADEAANWTEEDFGWALREAEARGDQAEVQYLQEAWDGLRRVEGDLRPRWGRHVIPGGENYQELLLTLPSRPKLPKRMATQAERNRGYASDDRGYAEPVDADGMVSDTFRTEFRGGHDREPNVLIRVRMDDRIGADGRKHLFLQELQSDWHLEGRDRGYRTGPQFSGELSAKEMPEGAGWEIRDENNVFVTNVLSTQARSRDEAIAAARRRIDNPEIGRIATDYRVPDAPLKGVWSDTAMRRMIRHASENGYDSISWTPGRMQQDRYDLSKHIDNIEVRQLSPKQAKDNNFSLEETRVVQINGKDGGPVYTSAVDKDGILLSGGPHQNKHLSEVVGNEVSQKIMATHQKKFEGLSMADEARLDNLSTKRIAESLDGLTPAERNEYLRLIKKREDASYRTLVKLEDLDLRVGGEWAENLYDKQLVNAANKWAKKRGGKVRKGTIERSPTPEDATRSMETWTLDITPEMKTGALLEGMPMYGLAGAGILTAAAARGIGETEREAY